MKQYKSYKDSGIDWLGKIPSHWNLLPLKYYISFSKGRIPNDTTEESIDYPYLTMDYLRNRNNKKILYPVNSDNLPLIEDGDIIVLWDGANAGEFLKSKKGYLGSTMAKISFDEEKYEKSYFFYLLSSIESISKEYANGTTIPHFDSKILIDFSYPCPSKEEQICIMSYLDSKVEQIDTVISEKELMLEDLNAYRSSIIREAVTKGLNKDIKMKESGIDWIGEIPENWDITKLSRVYPNIGSGTTPDTNNSQYYSEEGINWLQTGDLNDSDIFETSKHITELALKEKGLRIYPKGSLVIAMYGATIGKVGLLQICTTTNQACCVLPPNKRMSNIYTKFVLQAAKEVLLQQSVGGGQPNISQSIIKSLSIPMPPIEEQIMIAEKIQNKYLNIEITINELISGIEDLKKYRSSIITEAVTGKVDLRV